MATQEFSPSPLPPRDDVTPAAAEPSSIDLAAFIDGCFLPEQLADRRHRWRFVREAEAWLDRTLGRLPVVSDLTAENVASVERQLLERGYSKARKKQVATSLRRVARYAHWLGLIARINRRPRVPTYRRRNKQAIMEVDKWRIPLGKYGTEASREKYRQNVVDHCEQHAIIAPGPEPGFLANPPAAGTLSHFFETTLRNELVRTRRSGQRINTIASSVYQFDLHLRRYVAAGRRRNLTRWILRRLASPRDFSGRGPQAAGGSTDRRPRDASGAVSRRAACPQAVHRAAHAVCAVRRAISTAAAAWLQRTRRETTE